MPKALARPQSEIMVAERIHGATPAVAYGSAVNERGGKRTRRKTNAAISERCGKLPPVFASFALFHQQPRVAAMVQLNARVALSLFAIGLLAFVASGDDGHGGVLHSGVFVGNSLAGEPTNPVEFRRVGVTTVWEKYGQRLPLGRGQTLALVDDGCKLAMPEWTAKVGDVPKVRVTHDSVDGDDDPRHEGRGYHGSTIGIPSSLNLNGRWGVVPNNQVAVIRALECCHCNIRDSKSLAAGLQWIVDNADKHRITVVNLAPVDDLEHGEPVPTEIDEPLRKLRQMGIWVSAPTGNHQFTRGISWPACQTDCFAIGAVRPGKDEVYLDRHAKVALVVPAAATSSSNAIACGAAMILREAIETAKYDWKADGPTLPDAMLAIFQKTGPKVADPASGLAFQRLDLLAAVEHVLGN